MKDGKIINEFHTYILYNAFNHCHIKNKMNSPDEYEFFHGHRRGLRNYTTDNYRKLEFEFDRDIIKSPVINMNSNQDLIVVS